MLKEQDQFACKILIKEYQNTAFSKYFHKIYQYLSD